VLAIDAVLVGGVALGLDSSRHLIMPSTPPLRVNTHRGSPGLLGIIRHSA